MRLFRILLALALTAVALGGCGSDSDSAESVVDDPIRLVGVDDAAAMLDDPPDDLVMLDVRTPEEFDEGHFEGALLIDFQKSDFTERIKALDRDVPYFVYCRSGNRSGQATAMMADLGFTDITELDGGTVAWTESGRELVVDGT